MNTAIKNACDLVLNQTVESSSGVPGVVAMATTAEKTLYVGAAGVREKGLATAMTADTVFAIFSCTKGITAATVMQLVERGLLDLDAPAENYVPALGDIQVLDGFDTNGEPQLRDPKSKLTTRQLLLHTAGFAYDFFSEAYLRLAEERGLPRVITSSMAALQAPLLFDPGTSWNYGVNLDWAGQVVESIAGKRLGDVMQQEIFEPLGMLDTLFTMSSNMRCRLATIHQRGNDGSLTALPDLILTQEPEVQMGGHGLYSTAGDYLKFIRMLLNNGRSESGPILKPETVKLMLSNHLGELKISPLKSVIPTLSNDAEFFPEMSKSWGLSFMLNDKKAVTGRAAGAAGWAGLANLYYWIDQQNNVGGFWATQILPFADPASFVGYMNFEKAVYDEL